ncbi:MAG: DUF1571 domain-containing protein [Planctomycetota bacterium]
MVRTLCLCLAVAAILPAAPCRSAEPESESFDIDKLRGFIEEAEKVYAKVADYTAMFTKQERIGGELRRPDTFFMKFKKPVKVYLKWPKGSSSAGMEAIYVPGENNDKILLHTAGLIDLVLPTMEIDVEDEAVRKDNRHPITHLGIGYFLERFSKDFQRADQNDEITVYYRGKRKMERRWYHEVEMFLEPRQGNPGYYAYRSVVYFDVENKLPVQMLFYNWENQLIEFYAYKDISLNPDLADADFDPKNKEYNFGFFPLRLGEKPEIVPVCEVMPGCDRYAKVGVQRKGLTKLFAYGPARIYYLGYKGETDAPQVMACVANTTSLFQDEKFLVGVASEGKEFRLTRVVILDEKQTTDAGRKLLQGERFLGQMRKKSVEDGFLVGKDLDAVEGAEGVARDWAAGIRTAVQQLRAAFDNVDLRQAGAQAPKIQLIPPAEEKKKEKEKEKEQKQP